MYDRLDHIRDQLRQDVIQAWGVDTVVFGEPQAEESPDYAVILVDVSEGDASTPTVVDEVMEFRIIGRFRRPKDVVTAEWKLGLVRALVGYLTASATYGTYGYLPEVGPMSTTDLGGGDDPWEELEVPFTVHARGSRLGVEL